MEIKWNNVVESPKTLTLLFKAADKYDLDTAAHKLAEKSTTTAFLCEKKNMWKTFQIDQLDQKINNKKTPERFVS